MGKILLRPKAVSDLDSIWNYSAWTWGEELAEFYLRLLQTGFSSLASKPGGRTSCESIREKYWKLSVGRHEVFYRIHREGIEIVRVLSQRMDFKKHL